jgi:hypothetical protein
MNQDQLNQLMEVIKNKSRLYNHYNDWGYNAYMNTFVDFDEYETNYIDYDDLFDFLKQYFNIKDNK